MKPKNYIFLGLFLYVLPIVLFGEFNLYTYIFLPITIIILYWRMITKREKKYDSFINGALLGLFLSIYRLAPLNSQDNQSLLHFSHGSIIGYWTSFISYVIMYNVYKTKAKDYLLKKFGNDYTKAQREDKIDTLLSKW